MAWIVGELWVYLLYIPSLYLSNIHKTYLLGGILMGVFDGNVLLDLSEDEILTKAKEILTERNKKNKAKMGKEKEK